MQIPIESALAAAEVCCKQGCVYGYDNCPVYWKRVFKLHFGKEPSGDDDPDWDQLFRRGLKLRIDMSNTATEEQRAAS